MVQDFDDFEILVIDGGSRDGSLDLAKSYCENGCSKLAFFSEPSGIIHSYNRGLKEARGEIAMFVDDDVIADKDWVSRVVQVFDTDEKFAGVGGRIFDMGVMNRRPKRFGDIYDSLFYEKARARAIGKICKSGVTTRNFHLKTENPICVDYILGCNMSFRRRLLLDFGGFDENYEPLGFFFEPDICVKLRRAGYRIVFDPYAVVHHYLAAGGTRKFLDPGLRARGMFYENNLMVYFFLKNFSGNFRSFFVFVLKQFVDSIFPAYLSISRRDKEQAWKVIGKISGVAKFVRWQIERALHTSRR